MGFVKKASERFDGVIACKRQSVSVLITSELMAATASE
jgi:hypothetical protein